MQPSPSLGGGYMPTSPAIKISANRKPVLPSAAPMARSPHDRTDLEPALRSLQAYRQRLEKELTTMQLMRADETHAASAVIDKLTHELDAAERARDADSTRTSRLIDQLRAENALLTAAAGRMHEQWRRDAIELESIRLELIHVEAESERERNEAVSMMQTGARLAEAKYKSAERGRGVDVQVLRAELCSREAQGDELVQEHTRATLRLNADSRCAALDATTTQPGPFWSSCEVESDGLTDLLRAPSPPLTPCRLRACRSGVPPARFHISRLR